MSDRAVLYARVSGDDRDNEGRNLKTQLDLVRQYAIDKGYQIIDEIAEDDRGASSVAFELPGLNQVRELARAGGFDVLVVREMDRFSRYLPKQAIVEEELKRAGVRIEYALADYPDTPEGELNKYIRATIAHYERLKITERVVRGRRNKVKSGQVVSVGRVAYGYRRGVLTANGELVTVKPGDKAEGKSTLVPFESEARIVRLIFQWYAYGDGNSRPLALREIARRLKGVPTYGDRKGLIDEGRRGHWSKPRISALLKNETYAGRWHFGKHNSRTNKDNPADHVLTVEVPAIVDRALWQAAQDRLKQNKANSRRNRKREYLLARRVRCGACNARMHGITPHAESKRATSYYRCPARRATGYANNCDMGSYFRTDQVDGAVWDWVYSIMSDPVVLERGLKAQQAEQEKASAPKRTRLAVVKDLLADNRAQLRRLNELILDKHLAGGLPEELLTERKSHLETMIQAFEKERAELAAELEEATLTPAQVQSLHEFAADVRRNFELTGADYETRRGLFEVIRLKVVLAVEDGEKIAHASFLAWSERLSIESGTKYS